MKTGRKLREKTTLRDRKRGVLDASQAVFVVCLIINIFVILFVFAESGHIPPVVPLFYGEPQGDEQLAQRTFLAIPALVSSLFIFVDFFIIKLSKDEFVKNIFLGVIITTTALSIISVFKIFFLVGSF
jgi:hypothetical protein